MRKVILDTCYVDKQVELASKRIADVLATADTSSEGALEDVGMLRLQIRDLQRHNLELQFLVDNPGFDVDAQISYNRSIISRDCRERNSNNLYSRYGFDFFADNYHPSFIYTICTLLCGDCSDVNLKPHDLWVSLLRTAGFITKEITNNFGPVETDQGVI